MKINKKKSSESACIDLENRLRIFVTSARLAHLAVRSVLFPLPYLKRGIPYSPAPRVLAYRIAAQVLVCELAPSALLALSIPCATPHLGTGVFLVRGFILELHAVATIFTFTHGYNITPKEASVKGKVTHSRGGTKAAADFRDQCK